jgi:hypothetical protein
VVVNDNYVIHPVRPPETAEGEPPKHAAVRWLGVWLDRKLKWKRHVQERCATAMKAARFMRSLANTRHGPPAFALRTAVTTVIIPTALYAAECWYGGRLQPCRGSVRAGRDNEMVSARIGWHIQAVQKVINTALRATLPVWRTTPNRILCRDAGVPTAEAALEEIRLRFAFRLGALDEDHLLVKRTHIPIIRRGRGAGAPFRARTKLQLAARVFKPFPRPTLAPHRFTPGCRTNPNMGLDKESATKAFAVWWRSLPPNDWVVFSDGSEMDRELGYGYAIFRPDGGNIIIGSTTEAMPPPVATGKASLDPCAVVFDAEVLGALRGLQHTIRLADNDQQIHVCTDNTSAIWGLRGKASITSQQHFLAFHKAADARGNVSIKWSPGHMGIHGNEVADELAKAGLTSPRDREAGPTLAGVRMNRKKMLNDFRYAQWEQTTRNLAARYRKWELDHELACPKELEVLSRRTLHRFLALRTGHGDFAAYHRRFNHDEDSCEMQCPHCDGDKTPEHIVFCPKSLGVFRDWPWPNRTRRRRRPETTEMRRLYLKDIMAAPKAFNKFVEVTEIFWPQEEQDWTGRQQERNGAARAEAGGDGDG